MESLTSVTDVDYFSHKLMQARDPKSFPAFGHSKSDAAMKGTQMRILQELGG